MRRFLLLLAILFSSSQLLAASDGCTPEGSAFCADQQQAADYAKADVQLNTEYKRAMARLSKVERSKLRVAQRAWIKEREALCHAKTEAEWGGQCATTWCLIAETQCLIDEAVKRTAYLQKVGQRRE